MARIGGCDETTIEFGLTGETLVPVTREAFRIRETKFESRGVKLAGRLVMPPGDEPVPLAVILHGFTASSSSRNATASACMRVMQRATTR